VAAFVALVVLSLSQATGRVIGYGRQQTTITLFLLLFCVIGAGSFLIYRQVSEKRFHVRIWTSLLTLLTVAASVLAYSSYVTTPPFLVESITATARVYDLEARTGRIEGDNTLRVLKNNLSEILWGGIGSTGLTGRPSLSIADNVGTARVVQEAGEWQARLEFNPPLHKGQRASFHLQFEVTGSNPEPVVYLKQEVRLPTESMQLNIVVPSERPCKRVDTYSEDVEEIGAKRRPESAPFLYENGGRVSWSSSNPQEGRAYVLNCYW